MKPLPNLDAYEQPEIVAHYLHESHLLKGEQLVMDNYPDIFNAKKVLDIGIGGGRTTPALAAQASEYWGMDYSKAMVDGCKMRFPKLDKARFFTDDARTLEHCPKQYFNLAFFSFNGIDGVDDDGREAVLAAVRDALAPAGYFVFSFHNAGNLDKLYSYQWSKNPFSWPSNIRRVRQLNSMNGSKEDYRGLNSFIIKDGGDDFKTENCYTRPSWQARQVRKAGFTIISFIDSYKGKLLPENEIDAFTGPWIYLVCRKEGQ